VSKFNPVECGNCYGGEIVEDDVVPGVFFCNKCFKNVKIRKFKDSTR